MAMSYEVKTAVIAASAAGDNQVVAAVSGFKLRVLGYVLSASAAVNAKWKSGVGGGATDKTGLLYPAANGGAVAPLAPPDRGAPRFWFETNAGEALNLSLSGAVATGSHVTYQEVPA